MPNRLPLSFLILLLLLFISLWARANCVDSVHLQVKPVQCFGLRNGVIEVVEVIGQHPPYYFSLDGQTFSTRPVFDLLWAGEYILYVRDSTGCIKKFPVLVPEPEELKVDLDVNDAYIVAGEQFQIKATVYPANSALTAILWRPPALFPVQNQLVQSLSIADDTDFAIEVRNTEGCIARDNLSIQVEQTQLYAPNAFSPGSNQNNYFTVFSGEGVARVLYLQVYSRGGHLVFENRNFQPNDPLMGWNGKWRNRLAPPGYYVWIAEVEYLDGDRKRISGGVALVNH